MGAGGGGGKNFAEYRNIDGAIGAIISAKLATLHELDTVYGIEDVYLLLEIVLVDAHNDYVANEAKE